MTPRRLVQMATYLEPQQKADLDLLTKNTRVPTQVYVREAIDDLLKKYSKQLKRR